MRTVTLDASVWLAAMSSNEPAHQRAKALVDSLTSDGSLLRQPALFVIEVCATIARRTRDRDRAMAAGKATLNTPNLTIYPLTDELAAASAEIAATCALRGADSIYVATARRAGATLYTLDAEVLERAASVIEVRAP